MAVETADTPLSHCHRQLNAKMAPFAGWNMPLSYSSVLAEHHHVRQKVGLFDVSHMGEVFVSGKDASRFLQGILINDVQKIRPGQGQYTALCNEKGGMIDDLILYCLADDRYLLCVNASNTSKDFNWITRQKTDDSDIVIKNDSENWAQLAIQGPDSLNVLKVVLGEKNFDLVSSLSFTGVVEIEHHGKESLIARTGYTGEKGFEWYIPADQAESIWNELMESAPQTDIKPIGLGARDTLRLEACYLLYGQDMNDSVTPLEAGIAWATRLEAGPFVGSEIISEQKKAGVTKRIHAFKMSDQGIPRPGMDIYLGEEKIGQVTSGSVLPTVGGAGGMAMIKTNRVSPGDHILIDIRGKMKKATVEKKPLYTANVHQ